MIVLIFAKHGCFILKNGYRTRFTVKNKKILSFYFGQLFKPLKVKKYFK